MENSCRYIPYGKTGYFSKITIDYLSQSEQLQQFYKHPATLNGVKDAIKARQAFNTDRNLLVTELRKQYKSLDLTTKQEQNLQLLASNNTFTLTTAHQPNIFTGPLYFIYKILHVIKLADELTGELPDYKFVPVYYMGSEDADLDELGYINLNGQKLVWQTKQTGAVGRMKVDKELVKLIDNIHGQIGVDAFGNELTELLKRCYSLGKTIQQATLEMVNALFADFGLLVVIPDNAALKASFNSVIEKELIEQFSHNAVEETIKQLSEHYKVQAGGRELNLFYLFEDKRERIELNAGLYTVELLKLSFTQDEIVKELKEHPERFSANVILRGVFQETILPNILFVGGGGELAYWLELKKVFEAAGVPYPILLLRNSFLLTDREAENKIKKLGFSLENFFADTQSLLNTLVKKSSDKQLSLQEELKQADEFYHGIKCTASKIDATLAQHVEALQAKAVKRLVELEKKMLRAEKRNFESEKRHIQMLKDVLFPNNNLQERVENFSSYYAKEGKEWLNTIYNASKGLEQEFGIITA
ncbi:bacillithiol biosynthesis cysteine-adding enzyme BshC [Chitinophagaceae bacterium LWZ2-11]